MGGVGKKHSKAFKILAEPMIDLEKLGRHPVAERRMGRKYDYRGVDQRKHATYGHKKEIAMNRAANSNEITKGEMNDLPDSAKFWTNWTRRASPTNFCSFMAYDSWVSADAGVHFQDQLISHHHVSLQLISQKKKLKGSISYDDVCSLYKEGSLRIARDKGIRN